jgi:hypothetical protein
MPAPCSLDFSLDWLCWLWTGPSAKEMVGRYATPHVRVAIRSRWALSVRAACANTKINVAADTRGASEGDRRAEAMRAFVAAKALCSLGETAAVQAMFTGPAITVDGARDRRKANQFANTVRVACAAIRSRRRTGCTGFRLQEATGVRIAGGGVALVATRTGNRRV